MRVIVSRTDRIGDVVLTLPLCALLRERGHEVVFLGRGYTRAVLEASPHVDEIVDWDEVAGASVAGRADWLRAARADAIVHAFPRAEIARAAKDARIPVRIGTSHRLYHWLTCNTLESFTRRRSSLHEAQLNVRLARRLLGVETVPLAGLAPLTKLVPRVPVPADVDALLARDRLVVALHPKSRGSAREWSLEHWRALVESLPRERVQVLISGTVEEGRDLAPWLGALPPHVVDLTGRLDLAQLLALLAHVDGLVAASTGPLHVAAGAGTHALGLFSPTPPVHPGRWAPLGPRAEYLVAPAACDGCRRGGPCTCMEAITPQQVRERVMGWERRPTPR